MSKPKRTKIVKEIELQGDAPEHIGPAQFYLRESGVLHVYIEHNGPDTGSENNYGARSFSPEEVQKLREFLSTERGVETP